MKALIIDDSRLARSELKHLIQNIDTVEVIGEAANAGEAKREIEALNPDLIFLDIQMPGKDGFELLEELDQAPFVVFTTAYNEYAMKAFEYNALDYLQKPVTLDRLQVAVEKIDQKRTSARPSTREASLGEDSQVFVKDGDNCWFVRLSNIRLFETDGSYTKIHFEGNKPLIAKTLNYLETRLDPKVFFRANRQQVINLKMIDKIEPWFSGGIKILLKGGEEIEVSRRQTTKFKELMSF